MSSALAALTDSSARLFDIGVGDDKIHENAAAPRIVITPISGEPAGAVKQSTAVRTLANEVHFFEAEIWGLGADQTVLGADYAEVMSMRAKFTAAMRNTFGAWFKLMGGRWTAVRGESITESGRIYIQRFTLQLAVLDNGLATKTVTSTDFNIGVTTPGTDFVNP